MTDWRRCPSLGLLRTFNIIVFITFLCRRILGEFYLQWYSSLMENLFCIQCKFLLLWFHFTLMWSMCLIKQLITKDQSCGKFETYRPNRGLMPIPNSLSLIDILFAYFSLFAPRRPLSDIFRISWFLNILKIRLKNKKEL